MNATKKIALVIGISSFTVLPLMAGPVVTVQVPAPVVTVQTPAPAVTIEAVPDTYVWDGTEYVGVVGTQYYYLGTGNVWLPFDDVRVARFHDWEKAHADWRDHATVNVRFRMDAHGHEVPPHDAHDKDHDHDH